MRKFLEELVVFEKQEESRRLLFHQRFYVDDCHWGKDPGKLWRARSLKLLSVSSTAREAEVIASRLANNEPELYCQIRFRLSQNGQGWLICGVGFAMLLRCGWTVGRGGLPEVPRHRMERHESCAGGDVKESVAFGV